MKKINQVIPTFLTAAKIICPVFVLALAILTLPINWNSITQALYRSGLTAGVNEVFANIVSPEVPENLGWNLNPSAPTGTPPSPDQNPPSNTCTPGVAFYTNVDSWSHVWGAIVGDHVAYLRTVVLPDGSQIVSGVSDQITVTDPDDLAFIAANLTSSYSSTNTDWQSFTAGEGEYQMRVLAFADQNENGRYDGGEPISNWSDACTIAYDTSGPALQFRNIPLPDGGEVTTNDNFEIRANVVDINLTRYVLSIFDAAGALIPAGSDPENPNPHEELLTTSLTNFVVHTWDLTTLASGNYNVRLEAWDSLNNYSMVEQVVVVTAPNPGDTIITVSNSPEKDIENRVVNSSFENGLADWQADGEVVAIANNEESVIAQDGSQVVRIGGVSAESLVVDNSLTQVLSNDNHGLRSIGFWYKVVSTEADQGFDQPAFMVYVNDKMLMQIAASDLKNEENGLKTTGWQFASVYVANIDAEQLNLKFYAGNSGDKSSNTYVYLDNVTTNATVVNSSSIFTIHSENPEQAGLVHYAYKVNGFQYSGEGATGLQFTINGQPDNQAIEYWSTNEAGEASAHKTIQVLFDSQTPNMISNLVAFNEGSGEYSLNFTAPSDNLFSAVRAYDIRYSLEPITSSTDWNSLKQAHTLVDDILPGTGRAPKHAGQVEDLIVNGLEPNQNYYFAVKSIDIAGNWSFISNVVTAMNQSNPDIYGESPIVVNEIMYDPADNDSGNMPAGEWIELYNTADVAMDLAGWKIKDASGQEIVISAQNSDNNNNTADAGETTIPGKGWLVVYRNGNRLFNNDGDSVSLYNSVGELVNSYLYQGGVKEGMTEARATDGSEEWLFEAVATPGRANAATQADLTPSIGIWWDKPFNAKIAIFDAGNYTQAEYLIEYTHIRDGQEVTDAITGTIDINKANTVNKDSIYFAVCSTGGICTPYEKVLPEKIKLTVILKGNNLADKTLEAQLSGDWKE